MFVLILRLTVNCLASQIAIRRLKSQTTQILYFNRGKELFKKEKKKKKSEEENYCQSTTRKDFRKSMKASRQKYYSFRIHVENNERPKNRQIDRCTTKRFLTDSTMILQTKRLLFTLSNSYCLSARANNTPTDYCL